MPSRKITRLTAFDKQIKQALKLINLPDRLGDESPLSAYYFLGHLLNGSADVSSPAGRGRVLQSELHLAADMLWGDNPPASRNEILQAAKEFQQFPASQRYSYLVLEFRCLQRYVKPSRLSAVWEEYLPGSRAEHYRDFDIAVSLLGQELLKRLRPMFRLEAPMPLQSLVGYQAQIEACQAALREKSTISIHGPGGAGKSALAATVATTVTKTVPAGSQLTDAFWYTIRPTLNDRLEHYLFSLGYFLHQQGAHNLWNMLLIGNGKVDDLNLAMGLVREDLSSLASRSIILCFDELDLLKVSDPEEINEEHRQLQRFIESLKGHARLLLIGQRPFVESDLYVELTGLAAPQIQQLFGREEINLSDDESQQLYYHTNGNPRLLLLYRLLYQRGESWATLLTLMPETPALQPILNRLWTRLEAHERRILQQLAVFRSPAPADHWGEAEEAVAQLIQYRLIQPDGRGGISLVPALRMAIYQELTPELCERLHLEAANIRIERAAYTQTAYHYWRGGDENKAVEVWFAHREQEVVFGQATLAKAIFESISRRRLKPKQQKALDLIRAELNHLQGDAKRGLAALEESDWSGDAESSLRAKWLHGIFLDELGYPDAAIQTFRQGQATVHRLLSQLANFYYRAGIAHMRQHDKSSAWKEAYAAQYNALCLLGNLREQEGLYADATEFYEKALELTNELDKRASSTAHRFLSSVYGRQQRFQESIKHANLAIEIYEEIGDRLNREIVRSYLAATYLDMHHFPKAVATAAETLRFFKQIENSHFVATTAATMAEAYYELGDDANATEMAYQVLDQEEPYAFPYAHYTLGLVQLRAGDLPVAQAHLSEAALFAQQSEDPFIEAYARRALGRVYIEREMIEEATEALHRALNLFQSLGIENEIVETRSVLQEFQSLETD